MLGSGVEVCSGEGDEEFIDRRSGVGWTERTFAVGARTSWKVVMEAFRWDDGTSWSETLHDIIRPPQKPLESSSICAGYPELAWCLGQSN